MAETTNERWVIREGSHGGPMISPIDALTTEPVTVYSEFAPNVLSPDEARLLVEDFNDRRSIIWSEHRKLIERLEDFAAGSDSTEGGRS